MKFFHSNALANPEQPWQHSLLVHGSLTVLVLTDPVGHVQLEHGHVLGHVIHVVQP